MPPNCLIGEHTDERQIAIPLVVVQAIADHEFVGSVEADVVGFDAPLAGNTLSQENADLEAQRTALRSQSLTNGLQCHPAVEDVVQNQNMATTNVGKLSLANL